MNEQVDELHRREWRHPQASRRNGAMLVTEHLSKLDKTSGDGDVTARSEGMLARVADALCPPKEMVRAWMRLAEKLSFLTHVQAARKSAVSTDRKSRKEPIFKSPASQAHAKPSRQKSKLGLWKRIARPKGWAGLIATALCALLTVLISNSVAYTYLELRPYNYDGPERSGVRQGLVQWRGLIDLSTPVDTLVLGDSAAQWDLLSGPIADRLGGTAFNLGNVAGTTLLSDAWMLQYYVNKFGPPRNVILLRNSFSYEAGHNLEFMSVLPLSWGYWDRLGVAPVWEAGEERELYFSKEFPLYSQSDLLSYRLTHPTQLFPRWSAVARPYRNYSVGTLEPPDFGGAESGIPSWLLAPFNPSSDSANAVRAMSDLATTYGFQLYIAVGPEWDEAYNDPDRQSTVGSMEKWLAQFTDPGYVHLVLSDPMVFREDQMQSPAHLRLGAARQYTEAVLSDIVATQNRMAATQAKSIQVTSAVLDMREYTLGENPTITLVLTTNETADATAMIAGSVSALLRPSGMSDGQWTARVRATPFIIESGSNTEVRMTFSEGEIDEAGVYDLVLFLRQNAGGLSFETRVDLPSAIDVK